MASTTRRPTSRAAKAKPTKAPTSTTTDQLADEIASRLTISDTKGKQKVVSPEEARREAMRAVNDASQTLSNCIQSGWKASAHTSSKRDATATTILNVATSSVKHLALLRESKPKDIDVERAAVSLLGKLVVLEVYDAAAPIRRDVHAGLCSIVGVPSSELLAIPLPTNSSAIDATCLTLVFTYLVHALSIATQIDISQSSSKSSSTRKQLYSIDSFSDTLATPGTLSSWLPLTRHHESFSTKYTDALLMRLYNHLTKSSSLSQAPPKATFQLRVYALTCLAYTNPGTIEPDNFWSQATRFAGLYVKAVPATPAVPVSEDKIVDLVLKAYQDLVKCADGRKDRSAFLSGKGWVAFCENWLAFAKKIGDVLTIQYVAQLMNASGTPNETDSGSPEKVEPTSARSGGRSTQPRSGKELYLEGAQLCAALAEVAALMEQDKASSIENVKSRVKELIDRLASSPALDLLSARDLDEDGTRVMGKVDRALERLRRVLIRVLEQPTFNPGVPDDFRESAKSLLAAVVTTLKTPLRTLRHNDFLARSIDGLFVLAKASLNAHDPRTYASAFDYLQDAVGILNSLPETNASDENKIEPIDVGNYLRCISGAWHNMAGVLYQANRHGAAIGFLKEGCELGVKAFDVLDELVGSSAPDGQKESSIDTKVVDGWRQLEEGLYRRWELLAVCYSKIGDRKNAFAAFINSVSSFPYGKTKFGQYAGESTLDGLFGLSNHTKQLAVTVDRLTYIGALDLFLPSTEISLLSTSARLELSIVGALVERQIASLDLSRWKEGVRLIIVGLLNDAIRAYPEDKMPVRRSRVLLRCLEFLYHCSAELADKLPPVKLITDDVERLLTASDLKRDVNLGGYCTQYRASAYLWLALHEHRHIESADMTAVEENVQKGCDLLNSLLSDNIDASASKEGPAVDASKAQQPPTKESGATKRGAKAAVSRQRSLRKTPTTQDPVTPAPRTRKATGKATEQTAPPPVDLRVAGSALAFENFDRLADLLQLTARILGLLGLILTKVKVLDLLRKLCERYKGQLSEEFILNSIDLAQEYVRLGRTRRATKIFFQLWELVRSGQLPDELVASFYLRFAEALAVAEDIRQGSTMYSEALALSGRIDMEDKAAPTAQRIQTRVVKLERAALAAQVFSLLQLSKENMAISIEGRLQALRLWNRAADTLARLTAPPPTVSNTSEDNPFVTPSTETNGNTSTPKGVKQSSRRPATSSLEWRISEGLLGTLLSLSQAYFTRGSYREADYFAQQAQDLAESIKAPAMVSRALARRSELQMHQGMLEQSHENLSKAGDLLSDIPGIDIAEIHRLWARYSEKLAQHQDAQQLYGETRNMLVELDNAFIQFDGLAFGPRRSIGATPPETLVPEKLASILRQHITLLSLYGSDYNPLLENLLALPSSSLTKAEEQAALVQLGLQDVYARFRADMFLSSITESTMAMPMGMSSKNEVMLKLPTQDILATLEETERVSWSNLSLISNKGDVPMVRGTAMTLALIKAFQTSLGKSAAGMSSLATNLLDVSTAVTLRRELLEAIEHKFLGAHTRDDLEWREVDTEGDAIPPKPKKSNTRSFGSDNPFVPSDDDDDTTHDDQILRKYWHSIRDKYSSRILDPMTLSKATTELPSSWTIIHMNLTEDRNTLFVSRQQGGDNAPQPLIFCVPLKGRRDSGDEEDFHLTFDDAVAEFNEIIRLSDAGTRAAVNIRNDQEARANWWRERGQLDKRLRELLENIEFCWLGGFKTILSHRPDLSPEALSDLRNQLEKVFHRSLRLQDKQPRGKAGGHRRTASQAQASLRQVIFDDTLVECFSVLPPKCKDEELEDLALFILDLFQFHGVPIATAEVDITQLVVDLRAVLEDYVAKLNKRRKHYSKPGQGSSLVDENCSEKEHVFLVLDKNVQGFPWESIPSLRGRSVSRIPSVDFLVDRIQYAKALGRWTEEQNQYGTIDGAMRINGRKGYFVLNPSGDLKRTEERFKEWSDGMRKAGWDGIAGRPPSEQQLLEELRRNELIVYFGHGGAEQYIRSHKIRHLPKCGATMLWGCSSGILREAGDFDRTGTPYNYMLAGCPALVANLWDVTDRDIDKFSQSVFDHLHLTPNGVKPSKGKGTSNNMSLSFVTAVARSRDVCKLKYLTGAAPVIYGIPFYLG